MNSYFQGIPLNKAIIVRHTPNDQRDTDMVNNTGAIAMDLASTGLDYISRDGKYSDKGDIDRSLTAQDIKLSQQYLERSKAGLGLDYISRVGAFADKGLGKQVDASLWNQYGPVDKAELEKEMIESGGAFIDSFISVERTYAKQLGLETKEDFERLVRNTWNRSVEKWALIENPADIRWVAAFHSDANMSLHVHIYTWSAKGEIKPGTTIGKYQTREAKAVILREGYSSIRSERDKRAGFLRDLSILEAKRQLSRNIPVEKEHRINQRALDSNWPERLSLNSDVKPRDQQKLSLLCTKLRNELNNGEGRLSRNYQAQATAKDIVKKLEESSHSFSNLCELKREYAEIKADIAGFSRTKDLDNRAAFIKQELREQEKRLINAILREYAPSRSQSIPLRRDLEHIDARGKEGYINISFSEKLVKEKTQDSFLVRIPYKNPYSEDRYIGIPIKDSAEINNNKSYLAILSKSTEYPTFNNSGIQVGKMSTEQILGHFGRADMNYISRLNPDIETFRAKQRERDERRERFRQEREIKEKQYREYLERSKADLSPKELRQLNEYSTKYGLSLNTVIQTQRDAQKLSGELYRTGIKSYSDLNLSQQRTIDRLARNIVNNSKTIQQNLHAQALKMSRSSGFSPHEHYKELNKQAVISARNALLRKAEEGEFREKVAARNSHTMGQGLNLAHSVSEIIEALTRGSETANKHRHQRVRTHSHEYEHGRN